MFALFEVTFAAVVLACRPSCKFNLRTPAAMSVVAGLLSACASGAVPLVGKNPADPATRVAAVDYRSTIAPYTSMRPSTPAPWRERNDSVAPQSKQGQ